MFSYEHTHATRPDLNCHIEVGVDTIRIGFFAWEQSWLQRSRLKKKGWKYRSDWKCWLKHHESTGMRWRHWRQWIDVEVSLPRVIGPNNSSMNYDPWAALASIRKQLDADIELELTDSEFRSPDWDEWCVSRVDITADLTFEQATEVSRIMKGLPTAKMTHRPHRWDRPDSVKWSSKAKRVAFSIYDKYKKDQREIDKGKLRATVIFNERRNKPHLTEHGMRRVTGLFDSDDIKFLDIIVSEINRIRPKLRVASLRYLLEQAAKNGENAGSKNKS
ncbi:MAG TPA: hypothetical protein PK093_12285 [Phycisphaerae bacterium]|nr:hypothetical protein [Phycisphaerae bacterium]